jgi:hypothetical protein
MENIWDLGDVTAEDLIVKGLHRVLYEQLIVFIESVNTGGNDPIDRLDLLADCEKPGVFHIMGFMGYIRADEDYSDIASFVDPMMDCVGHGDGEITGIEEGKGWISWLERALEHARREFDRRSGDAERPSVLSVVPDE